MTHHVSLLIDGKWTEGSAGQTLDVINPATEEICATVAKAETADLENAARAAARSFPNWSNTSPYDRSRIMRRAADLLRDRRDHIARLLTTENGKPISQARVEVDSAADMLDWFAEEGRRSYGRVIAGRTPGVHQYKVSEPIGPVAAFTPWNFPISQVVKKLAAALAAGCTLVIKAAEETPASAAELVRACVDAGMPDGVINLVFGISDPAPFDPEGLVHRVDGSWQATRFAGRSAHEADDNGARWPRSGNRLFGQRYRASRKAHCCREIPKCGTGLHRTDKAHCAKAGL